MKKLYLALIGSLIISQLFGQEIRKIDLEKSQITWEGTTLFRLGGHFGTVKFESGQLEFTDGALTAGGFIVDMNSIVNTDGEFMKGLVDHLKNEDFFDVAKFPTAALNLTKVEAKPGDSFHMEASMQIRGISNPIVMQNVNKVRKGVYRSVFIIDRAKWKIKYASNSFFDDLGNDVISDAIKLDVIIWLKEDQ